MKKNPNYYGEIEYEVDDIVVMRWSRTPRGMIVLAVSHEEHNYYGFEQHLTLGYKTSKNTRTLPAWRVLPIETAIRLAAGRIARSERCILQEERIIARLKAIEQRTFARKVRETVVL